MKTKANQGKPRKPPGPWPRPGAVLCQWQSRTPAHRWDRQTIDTPLKHGLIRQTENKIPHPPGGRSFKRTRSCSRRSCRRRSCRRRSCRTTSRTTRTTSRTRTTHRITRTTLRVVLVVLGVVLVVLEVVLVVLEVVLQLLLLQLLLP